MNFSDKIIFSFILFIILSAAVLVHPIYFTCLIVLAWYLFSLRSESKEYQSLLEGKQD